MKDIKIPLFDHRNHLIQKMEIELILERRNYFLLA